MSILWNSLSWVHWIIRLYSMESGKANVSRILGVLSLTLSRYWVMLSFLALRLSILTRFIFSFCSRSYFFLASLDNPAYHASKAAFLRALYSRV